MRPSRAREPHTSIDSRLVRAGAACQPACGGSPRTRTPGWCTCLEGGQVTSGGVRWERAHDLRAAGGWSYPPTGAFAATCALHATWETVGEGVLQRDSRYHGCLSPRLFSLFSLRLLRRRVCQLLPQHPALGRPRVFNQREPVVIRGPRAQSPCNSKPVQFKARSKTNAGAHHFKAHAATQSP